MLQIEKRFYNLDELAEITGINRKSKNFKRDVENILGNWGYGHQWINRRGATITYIPTTAEERLQELLVRQYHIDIQVNMFDFACFIYAIENLKGFDSMPWNERETYFLKTYGKRIDERILRKWCSTLLKQKVMLKTPKATNWKTEIYGDKKYRSPASEEEVKKFNKRRSELLELWAQELQEEDPALTDENAIKKAWDHVYSDLWAEFHCCYYYCKSFYFAPWDEQQADTTELFELVDEVLFQRGFKFNVKSR